MIKNSRALRFHASLISRNYSSYRRRGKKSQSCIINSRLQRADKLATGGGGKLPSNILMGMGRWMGYFKAGLTFSLELVEWDRTFSGFVESENSGT